MTKDNFTVSQYLIISIIAFNILAVVRIPGFVYSEKINYFLQIIVFILFIYIDLNLIDSLKINKIKFNVLSLLAVLIILFFLFSSIVVNLTNNIDVFAIIKLFTFPIIIFLFYIRIPQLLFNNDILFDKLLNYWLFFSISSIIISLIVLVLGLEIFQYSSHSTIGYFYYTNIFAFIFTFTIPILIYKYFTKSLQFISLIIFLLPSLVCLLFTFSRAGYIGVLASILIMVYKRSRALFFLVLILILLIGSTIIFQFATAKGTASAFSRAQVMYVGYNMIYNNGINKFLWGYGIYDSKRIFVQELSSTFGLIREETGPHNFILTLGIQFGMLMTLTVVFMILYILFRSINKIKRKYDNPRYYKIYLSVAVVSGILIQCLLEDIVVYPEFFVMPLFLIFLGYLKYHIIIKE